MPKIIHQLLLLIILCYLTACGSTNKTSTQTNKSDQTSTQAVAVTADTTAINDTQEASKEEKEEEKEKAEIVSAPSPKFINEAQFNDIGRTFPDLKITDLDAFLSAVQQDVEHKNWGGFFAKASKKHYAEKITIDKIKPPHYIATVLGINDETNSISGKKNTNYDHLKRLKTITYDTFALEGPRIVTTGKALLDDDSSLNLKLFLEVEGNRCRLGGPIQ